MLKLINETIAFLKQKGFEKALIKTILWFKENKDINYNNSKFIY